MGADSERVRDEPAFAAHEQRALSVAEENYRGAANDDDRFRAAEYSHGRGSQREAVVFQPGDGAAGAAGFVPDRFRGGGEFVLPAGFDFSGVRPGFFSARSRKPGPARRKG